VFDASVNNPFSQFADEREKRDRAKVFEEFVV
jgi:hypothetical protein